MARYFHPCQECRYLGTDVPKLKEEMNSKTIDLYVHDHGEGYLALHRRYGDDEDDLNTIEISVYGTLNDLSDPAWTPILKKVFN